MERHIEDARGDVASHVSGRATRHRVALDDGRQDRHFEDASPGAPPHIRGRENRTSRSPVARWTRVSAVEGVRF
jgi:hypothetical protein